MDLPRLPVQTVRFQTRLSAHGVSATDVDAIRSEDLVHVAKQQVGRRRGRWVDDDGAIAVNLMTGLLMSKPPCLDCLGHSIWQCVGLLRSPFDLRTDALLCIPGAERR